MSDKECEYCENGQQDFKIREAYGKDKLINEEIHLYLDGYPEDPILSIDYKNEESSGFYVDINFCPFCGKKLRSK